MAVWSESAAVDQKIADLRSVKIKGLESQYNTDSNIKQKGKH